MTMGRLFGRRRKDQDFAEEIESHLAHEEDANWARGLLQDERVGVKHVCVSENLEPSASGNGAIVPSPRSRIWCGTFLLHYEH
jgi:hypothetical protein